MTTEQAEHGFRLGAHHIRNGGEPVFIAELGICHGGCSETALRLAKAAIDAGAHCIKTESFHTASLVLNPSATCTYTLRGEVITEPLVEHMLRYELPLETHQQICALCRDHHVPFMATVHDMAAVDAIVAAGASALKIASPDVVHYPLLRHVARTGLPVFLDTGAALLQEIQRAVQVLASAGQRGIVVNHNPSGHPAPAGGHHLCFMQRLQKELGVSVGISDHYAGDDMALCAVVMGAVAVEKPVSFDNTVPEPERAWSVNVQDIPVLMRRIAEAYAARGSEERILDARQENYRAQNRLACAASRDLSPGEPLTLDNITFGRPCIGIGVEHWDDIAGRTLLNPKKKHEFLGWEDI